MEKPLSDNAPQDAVTSNRRRLARRWLTKRTICYGAVSVSLFAVTESIATSLLKGRAHGVEVPWSVIVLLVVALFLATLGICIHFLREWIFPASRLVRLIKQVHAGEISLDEMRKQSGALACIVPAIENILRDLKQQRGHAVRLANEMRQKVAQRTDALERAMGSLRAQATRDALTGLYNRRMLNDCLDNLITQCVNDQSGLSLLMIDVDDFKLLNDTLGHAQGDDLLRAIGQLIRSSLRPDDLGFRCGGDEFVVVMPASMRSEAQSVLRRLMELVDALTKQLAVPRKPRLSIGLATLVDLDGPKGAKQLLELADQKLYAVKAERKQGQSKPVRAA